MDKQLRDTINWQPTIQHINREKPLSYVKPLEPNDNNPNLEGDPVGDNEDFAIVPKKDKPSEILQTKARKFVELLQEGKKPYEAADMIHTPMSVILSDKQIRDRIQKNINRYNLDASVRKLLVRALTNKVIEEGLNATDEEPTKTKLALDAAKLAMQDTELGMVNQGPSVNIDLSGLADLLDKAPPSLPGITEPEPESIIIDVLPDDNKGDKNE